MNAASATFWERIPLGRGVQLITRDQNGMAAFAKPAGVLSHPNSPRDRERALVIGDYDMGRECFEWAGESGATERLWLLNRLDSATSGVILAAGDERTARAVKDQFKRRSIAKAYCALVFGSPRPPTQLWKDFISVDKRGGMIRTGAAGRVPAESRMSLMRSTGNLSLLRLEPLTGRSHQLRVQCAKRGLPIVGDQTYGEFARNREFARATRFKRLFLHSLETSFEYELAGGRNQFLAKAPLPPEFEECLGT